MNKIKYLNGLKGIGAIMVFLCHYHLMGFPMPSWMSTNPYASLLIDGGFAVAFFIIISGFTAWLSVERKFHDMALLSQMAVNRYFRFAVPFGVVFIMMFIAWHLGAFDYHVEAGNLSGSETLKTAFWPVSIVGFIKALLLSPVNPDFWDAPLWMMKYVFFGTYIAIIVRMGIDNMSPKCKLLALVVVLVLFGIGDIFYLGILMGFLFSYLYKQPVSTPKKLMGGQILFILFLIIRWKFPVNASVEVKNFSMAIVLLLAIYLLPFLQRILESRPLQYFGKISFSIYIFHWPIMGAFTSYVYVKVHSFPYAFPVVFGLTLVAVILFSHLSERFIERGVSNFVIKRINQFLFVPK